jgi:hypothetical protein
MSFFAPKPGDRYTRHVFDLILTLDAIERGDIDDEVTTELLEVYDPVWWMHALELLSRIRAAVEQEIVRCISDVRVDYEVGDEHSDEFEFATPSWDEIGKRLGVSAQAARQRYAKQLRPHSVTGESVRRAIIRSRELAPEHPSKR